MEETVIVDVAVVVAAAAVGIAEIEIRNDAASIEHLLLYLLLSLVKGDQCHDVSKKQ